MGKRKKKMLNPRKECTNCKYNRGKECSNMPEDVNKESFPKVFNCKNWVFTSAYFYSGTGYYGKFHTEA